MKNLLSLTAVVLFAGMGYANQNPKKEKKDTPPLVVEADKECYGRVCKTESTEVGNGVSVEIKVCGDWQKIPCKSDEEKSNTFTTE